MPEEQDTRTCDNCAQSNDGDARATSPVCVSCVFSLWRRRGWRPKTLQDQQNYQNYLIRTKRRDPNHVQQEEEED
jgi:hypothetical protein